MCGRCGVSSMTTVCARDGLFEGGYQGARQATSSTRAFSSNSYLVLRTAAMKGIGISLLPTRTVRGDLTSGALIELLKGQPLPERPLYAAFAPDAPLPEKVHRFLDHL